MQILRVPLLLSVLGLVTWPAVALLSLPVPSPPCRVQANSVRTSLTAYTVTVSVRPGCPSGGQATVRLGGGSNTPWRTVRPGQPAVFTRVPWYWRGDSRVQNGANIKIFHFNIPGMVPPWSLP